MRVLLVVGNRSVRQVLADHLKAYGLLATVSTLAKAMEANDGPAVILWVGRWTAEAANVVHQLEERQAVPFLVCPEAARSSIYLAILQAGARASATGDRDALEALVLQVARGVQQRAASQWQLGPQVFDVLGGCLFDAGERLALSPVEVRLLRRLCLTGAADPAGRLTTRALTAELPAGGEPSASREASVRNYITKLRRLLEDDPEHPQVLLRDGGGYYIVLGTSGASVD